MSYQIVLVHLHLDFEQHIAELLRKWNAAQNIVEFVGVRPSRRLEHSLLTPGTISDDEASRIAARIRTEAGYSTDDGIIVFTEKRLFDNDFYQLFVGGREVDEDPPRVAVLSVQFMRREYENAKNHDPRFFSAIVSNILFSVGIDVGLADHGNETRGCVMDFCGFMSDIEIGLAKGPAFCEECTRILKSIPNIGSAVLALPEVFKRINDIEDAERDVTKAILLRGQQYVADKEGFDYDVALSFSGSDREYAERLSDELRLNGIAVFYDRSEQWNLWGRNLQLHLAELYRIRARYCIVLMSTNYFTSRWTKVELEAALAHEFERGDTYILPLRLDDTELSGLLPTRAFVDARRESIESIVVMVKSKLATQH
ncbi:MAG: TIR domain-containing protein [Acidobacteria bacterium]|nr:TIR domain-containing protein [Acidobacteriota bacterium]